MKDKHEDQPEIEAETPETEFDPETGEVHEDDEDEDQNDLKLETLSGDLRDAMLTRFRQMQKPWEAMNEGEQREFCEGIGQAARNLVRQTVRLFSGYEWPHAVVQLGEIKIIGGDKSRIEGKVIASNITENRDVLGEHVAQYVMLVCVDSDTFMNERGPVKIDPDQPELPEHYMTDSQDDELEGPRAMTDEEADVYLKAVTLVEADEKVSASLLKSKLGVSIKTAELLIDHMEERGVVTAPDASGVRAVMIDGPEEADA